MLIPKQRYDVGEKIRRFVDVVNTKLPKKCSTTSSFFKTHLVDIDETMLTAVNGHIASTKVWVWQFFMASKRHEFCCPPIPRTG
ncbi:MAG: hypothetical protein O3A00_20080, partial [Planctomycetota bacterium]|nr:hypothetical protein [Planctomycetota bacterium]